MRLHHEFTVPVTVEDAWQALLDIEGVAPCMPGATLEGIEGDTLSGAVKVKVGPITVTYRGTATFEEKDASAHRVVLAATGKEVRGQGTARAEVSGALAEHGGGTAVSVDTDLTITGRPAQFGRGVMNEVGDKIIGQFASCLSQKLTRGEAGPAEPGRQPQQRGEAAPSATAKAAQDVGGAAPYEAEPIDLLRAAGIPVAKRAAVCVAAAALTALIVFLVRRKR